MEKDILKVAPRGLVLKEMRLKFFEGVTSRRKGKPKKH